MAQSRNGPLLELIPAAQSYDWGKLGKDGSKVSQYAKKQPSFEYDENKPYAELWMGSHPSLPSRLVADRRPLGDYIREHPSVLGDKVRQRYGDDLPFLFKVLAIGKALSVQAHPDKKLGERLHKERPDVYKDPNHKPEMAIALTQFSGFCGFRPLPEISSFLSTVPEFAAVVGSSAAESFTSAVPASSSDKSFNSSTKGDPSRVTEYQAVLRELFSALMNADPSLVKDQVRQLVARYQREEPEKTKRHGTVEELVTRLNDQFPDDVGIFCSYVLNVIELQPGQAAFLKANEPHAYLTGDIVECMATSDNVVRAGLTPKLRDVPTLTSMLTYSYGPASTQLMKPEPFRSCRHTTLYDPPIDEFSVLLTALSPGQADAHPPLEGPSIMIVTEGKGKIQVGKDKQASDVDFTGQVYFVAPGEDVVFTADAGSTFVVYRAFVEVS